MKTDEQQTAIGSDMAITVPLGCQCLEVIPFILSFETFKNINGICISPVSDE